MNKLQQTRMLLSISISMQNVLQLAGLFRLVLAVPPPWSSLYLHLPGSFEALAMKGAQSSTDATQKCQRRDRFSFIYRG